MNTTIITSKKNTASTKSVYFTFNFFEKTIVGKDVDFELAGNPSTAQYTQLMERMAIQPTFKLSPVETEKKVKRTYAGLTRELMAEYLEIKKEAVYKNALESLRQMKKDEVGYYISKPLFAPYELRLMVDSIQSSKFITQAEARSITNKIKGLADVYTRDSLNRTAYVANRVRSKNESVVQDADKIHQAIAGNRKIGFRYFHYTPNPDNPKVYSKKGDPYKVSPFALHWDNGNYYLYAYVDEKRGFRSFRVDRMERITHPLSEEREAVEQFKAENITSQEAKVFQSYHGERYTVKIRFSNHLADAVIDQFGKEAMLMPTDEKHFTITTPIEISPPFFAWLATFGRGAKILYPATVVEKMREFIRRCADMYENEEEG